MVVEDPVRAQKTAPRSEDRGAAVEPWARGEALGLLVHAVEASHEGCDRVRDVLAATLCSSLSKLAQLATDLGNLLENRVVGLVFRLDLLFLESNLRFEVSDDLLGGRKTLCAKHRVPWRHGNRENDDSPIYHLGFAVEMEDQSCSSVK